MHHQGNIVSIVIDPKEMEICELHDKEFEIIALNMLSYKRTPIYTLVKSGKQYKNNKRSSTKRTKKTKNKFWS